MPIANLKRHRSASTSHTQTQSSKLSRLKSKLAVFTKFRPFTSQNVAPPSPPLTPPQQRQRKKDRKPWKRWSHQLDHRRPSIASSFFQYWRNDTPYSNDSIYEQARYHGAKKCHSQPRLDLLHRQQQNATQNAQTVPASPPPHCIQQVKPPASILVKREVDSAIATTQTKPSSSSCLLPHRRRSSSSRHMRHVSSSNITVNSEDLTAKEFADIAGIRILLDNDTDNIYDDLDNVSDVVMHTVSTEQRTHFSSCSSNRQPKIWDAEFWFDPCSPTNNNSTASSSGAIPRRRSVHHPDGQPRIFNELRQMQSTDKLSNCVIKKGRFEICLEAPDRSADPAQDAAPPVPIITVNNTEES
ncbi:hypothetical protein BJV82DRAFT_616200 [Fennellomyces sp. T-0311]|nr:hypothetical protein BJV82DRAFT_616200 [Fennellomyces sp. T-0311]